MRKDFVDWLNEELNKRGWSQSELARRSGVSHATISEILSYKRKPTFEVCAAIARPLDKRPEELFRLAGLIPALRGEDAELTLRELTEIARSLSLENREQITRLARLLLREQQESYGADDTVAQAAVD